MTTTNRPTYNRCDYCGRNPHKVAVRIPRPANRPAVVHGVCPSCFDSIAVVERLGSAPGFIDGTELLYDHRVRKSQRELAVYAVCAFIEGANAEASELAAREEGLDGYNAQGDNPVPDCTYCGKPVGDNEWDSESGGYFSSHFGCSSPDVNGAFGVEVWRNGASEGTAYGSRRFTTEKRARAEADHLARSNYSTTGVVFQVVGYGPDTEQGQLIDSYPARLRDPREPAAADKLTIGSRVLLDIDTNPDHVGIIVQVYPAGYVVPGGEGYRRPLETALIDWWNGVRNVETTASLRKLSDKDPYASADKLTAFNASHVPPAGGCQDPEEDDNPIWPKCPECGAAVWDGPKGDKLAKCWNTEGHASGGTLAFDTMGDDNPDEVVVGCAGCGGYKLAGEELCNNCQRATIASRIAREAAEGFTYDSDSEDEHGAAQRAVDILKDLSPADVPAFMLKVFGLPIEERQTLMRRGLSNPDNAAERAEVGWPDLARELVFGYRADIEPLAFAGHYADADKGLGESTNLSAWREALAAFDAANTLAAHTFGGMSLDGYQADVNRLATIALDAAGDALRWASFNNANPEAGWLGMP